MIPSAEQPFFFVDLETTGANPERDRITEIGIVQWDGVSVEEWSSLVNPRISIPSFIQQLTGISDEMVRDAPAFTELAQGLWQRLNGQIFLAHNARFDHSFLKQEFARMGMEFRARVLCTVKLSRKLFPGEYKHNLDSVAARTGLDAAGNRHRALTDARLIQRFVGKMVCERGWEVISDALDHMHRPANFPEGVAPELVDALPDTVGAYRFSDENKEVLFVGHADNIKRRVVAHFSPKTRTGRGADIARMLRDVSWLTSAGELGARLLERRWIRELHPRFNAHNTHQEPHCTWGYQPNADGTSQPGLLMLKGQDALLNGDCFGLFGSKREASNALRKIAEANRLCNIALGLEPRIGAKRTPCSSFQASRCRGACMGKESLLIHQARVCAALSSLRLPNWPYARRAAIVEASAIGSARDLHVFDGWCFLGTVHSEEEARDLFHSAGCVEFDVETFKIVRKFIEAHPGTKTVALAA